MNPFLLVVVMCVLTDRSALWGDPGAVCWRKTIYVASACRVLGEEEAVGAKRDDGLAGASCPGRWQGSANVEKTAESHCKDNRTARLQKKAKSSFLYR